MSKNTLLFFAYLFEGAGYGLICWKVNIWAAIGLLLIAIAGKFFKDYNFKKANGALSEAMTKLDELKRRTEEAGGIHRPGSKRHFDA